MAKLSTVALRPTQQGKDLYDIPSDVEPETPNDESSDEEEVEGRRSRAPWTEAQSNTTQTQKTLARR
jgi:hypothetical protein